MHRRAVAFALVVPLAACGASPSNPGSGGASSSSASSSTSSSGSSASASSSGAVSSSSSSSSTGSSSGASIGNALLTQDGAVVPLYPVTGNAVAARAIGFVQKGSTITAIDETGKTLWTKDEGAGEMFGGFDLDGDGVIDLGLVRTTPSGQDCGGQPMNDTSIDVVLGATGALSSLAPKTAALCWMFASATYPTPQWTDLDVLFGGAPGLVAIAPYYATTGQFLKWDKGQLASPIDFDYPSSPAYDQYAAAKPNAHGTGHDYEQYAHVANGSILDVGGEPRLVFFTTARVVQYAVAPHGPAQLVADTPFLTAGRTDLVGRDYGLVERDPSAPDTVALISGTSAFSLSSDQRAGTMQTDPWGQIERHVTLYNLTSGVVDDRFFSYAHDQNDGMKYEGRVAYPNDPFVRRGPGMASRLAFDVYEGGHWQLHVTEPGATKDAVVLADTALWDIRDLDGDGTDEWVLTPTRDPQDPDVPGYYFTKWRTVLAHWDEATLTLQPIATHAGAIPYLQATFRRPDRTTSFSFLYPSLTVAQGGALALLLVDAQGSITAQALP